MATIHVDGKEYQVDGADNLLQACLSLGLDIPYFCWHPALGSVGACRQCAVKQYANADDTRGRLVMSCMTPAADNTYIAIADDEAREFRASVVEWLMTNHPHDCPVCEEGGNCHLQDMTVMTGHSRRRYRFAKRTHRNQELGPFIGHEMNRCIACYRCVRYYRDYAQGTDFGVYGAHDNLYFGRVEDGALENEFSGNLVEVCPTGVFTDKTHSARYNRKWDMQFAPSICQQCAVGCNISPGERYGELRRIENRYNGVVNHYFLCDRGRFGYGYVNALDRPRTPLLRSPEGQVEATVDAALLAAADRLRGAPLIGIGSPRASVEANFALRELVGADNFSTGIAAAEWAVVQAILDILQAVGDRIPSLREMEDADAVLVLGEDVTQTAPRIALALRQASRGRRRELAAAARVAAWQAAALDDIGQHERQPLFVAGVQATRLDDIADACVRRTPEDLARLGFAVAHAIDPTAPAVADLDADQAALAARIAATLCAARRPLLVSGSSLGSVALIEAVAHIAAALGKRGVNFALSLVAPEVNTLGVALLGGLTADAALARVREQGTGLIVLENDLARRVDPALVDTALAAARAVVAVDHQATATTAAAAVVLPAASFAEGDGTVVSQEGRAQRYFQVYDPAYYNLASTVKESWRWLQGLGGCLRDTAPAWGTLDEITGACARAVPALARITAAAEHAEFRIGGRKIARQPLRYSGRTAMRANVSVHEPRVPQDPDSALTFSMEGYGGAREPGALTPFAWAPGWNSPQAWNKFQDEVGGHLRAGDGGVRLFDTAATPPDYCASAPAAFAARADEWRLLPLYHIFGSEELSVRAPAVASRVPAAYVAIASADAGRLGVAAGGALDLTLGATALRLSVRIDDSLPAGTLGVPVGLPGVPPLPGQAWARARVAP